MTTTNKSRCFLLVAMLEDDFLSRDNWHMIINSKDSFLCGRSRNFLKLPGQSLLVAKSSGYWEGSSTVIHLYYYSTTILAIVEVRRFFQQQLQHRHKIDKSVTRPCSAARLSKNNVKINKVLKNSPEFNYSINV